MPLAVHVGRATCGVRTSKSNPNRAVQGVVAGFCHFRPGKPCKVAIERDPLAAPFDGERREPGIGDARSARVGLDAKSA